MSILILLVCDEPVPYGVCGSRYSADTRDLGTAVEMCLSDGWTVRGKTVACPAHTEGVFGEWFRVRNPSDGK